MISYFYLIDRAKQAMTGLVALLFFSFGNAQLTITITSIPSATPLNTDIYITGNFIGWSQGNADYKLTNNNDGTYVISFSPNLGPIEYKFTRGSQETEEGSTSGSFLPARSYTYSGGPETIEVSIEGWKYVPGTHTTTPNVRILDEDFFIPQLNRSRRIWLYLPPDYTSSTKKYPVIYMQDGQNLFDTYYSISGEWRIDETMNDLFMLGDYGAIVVGIDNGGTERNNEYSPWFNEGYGGGDGAAYAAFLVNTLKPYIDSAFRTLPGREYTAIAGGTLGANISLFTAIEYQDIFSKIGVFSPGFWFSASCYDHVREKGITRDLRIYFVAGQHEGETNITNMLAMYNTLAEEGQDLSDMYFLNKPDGAHNEWFWAREYSETYTWLFDDTLLANKIIPHAYWKIYPNPAGKYITVLSAPEDLTYSIYALNSTLILSGKIMNGGINISTLTTGAYYLHLRNHSGETVYISRFSKQ